MKRRGELSSRMIGRGWPHQVALPEPSYVGRNHTIVLGFIADEGQSLCVRGHGFFRDGVAHHVFCFADEEHAQRFHARFGGEMMTPDTRPRWPSRPSLVDGRKKKGEL